MTEGSNAGVRPTRAERRAMLIAQAAPRFQRLGYHRVSVADIALEAGVTAPAVYRHFASKGDLLAGTITSGLDLVEAAAFANIDEPLEILVAAIADVGLERPDLWVLLQREARFLGPEHRRCVNAQFERVVAVLVNRLRRERPRLGARDARMLVAGAMSVLSTPSIFRLSTSRSRQRQQLVRSAAAVLRTDLTVGKDVRPARRRASPGTPGDRRSQLLQHAIALFFERGYNAVTLDEIGAAVGIAGPSVYHHFATKADLLMAASDEAVVQLREHRDAAEAELAPMVGWYVDFCLRSRALVGVYVSESVNLPLEVRREVSSFLYEQVERWSVALVKLNPELDRPSARIRVQSAHTLIVDVVRLGRFHQRADAACDIRSMALTALFTASPARA